MRDHSAFSAPGKGRTAKNVGKSAPPRSLDDLVRLGRILQTVGHEPELARIEIAHHADQASLSIAARDIHHDALDDIGSLIVEAIGGCWAPLVRVDVREDTQADRQRESTACQFRVVHR